MERADIDRIAKAGGGFLGRLSFDDVSISGSDPVLATDLAVGEAAAVAIAGVGVAARRLAGTAGSTVSVSVPDAAGALLSFARTSLDGAVAARTNAANPLVALYPTRDGRWIHLHGGFPGLARRTLEVLGLSVDSEPDPSGVAEAVGGRGADELEGALAVAGTCGAVVRSEAEWAAHPQARAVGETELTNTVDRPTAGVWSSSGGPRPLQGLRVLDLTRVLAGPTAGRTLAALGADVFQLRHPDLPHVPAFELDTGFGKRRATADLSDPVVRDAVRRLARSADVVIQGYRPGVAEGLGLGEEELRRHGWAGIYGSLSCYGHVGPWRDRPGWEQLAQSVSGMIDGEPPQLVPAAVNDYLTGYLLAGAVMHALAEERSARVDVSLVRTAMWITSLGRPHDPAAASGPTLAAELEFDTPEGRLRTARPVPTIEGVEVGWPTPPQPFAPAPLEWSTN